VWRTDWVGQMCALERRPLLADRLFTDRVRSMPTPQKVNGSGSVQKRSGKRKRPRCTFTKSGRIVPNAQRRAGESGQHERANVCRGREFQGGLTDYDTVSPTYPVQSALRYHTHDGVPDYPKVLYTHNATHRHFYAKNLNELKVSGSDRRRVNGTARARTCSACSAKRARSANTTNRTQNQTRG
jgi:hypothetical protein